MDYFNYMCFFIYGLVFASFLNALGYRMDKGYKYPDIFIKPSACEKCKTPLKWYELIPVIGYILNKGRCSKCQKKINIYYPISELFLGLTFLILFVTHSPISFYVLSLVLFFLTYFDIETMSIPKKETDILLTIALLYKVYLIIFVEKGISFSQDASLIFSLGLLVVVSIINRWKEVLGIGDLLILIIISSLLPFASFILYLYLTILLSGTVSIILIVFNKEYLKKYIPLLPFMTMSFVLTVLTNYYFPTLLHTLFPVFF
ncbi:MAG TPA: prepilin peptidase [Candidatus Dojkabacteria bacterium]|nr:prepilin peptidase [Candidatus Dojkabacteria bacterium]